MGDGSFLAFFEAPAQPFEFKDQHDFDLHIALEDRPGDAGGHASPRASRGHRDPGVADHGFIHSIYFRDPNGYVIELSVPTESAAAHAAQAETTAHAALAQWQETKPQS